MLCLSLGIESKAVEPLNPFANLLLISNIMDDSSPVAKVYLSVAVFVFSFLFAGRINHAVPFFTL